MRCRRATLRSVGGSVLVVVIAVSVCTAVAADGPLVTAVVGFKTGGLSAQESNWFNESFVDQLSAGLLAVGRYTVVDVDKQRRRAILEEIEFSLSDISANALRAGRLLAADLFLVGSVGKTADFLGGLFTRRYFVTIKAVAVETGKTVAALSKDYPSLEAVSKDAREIARALLDKEILVYSSTVTFERDRDYAPPVQVRVSGKSLGALAGDLPALEIPSGWHTIEVGTTSFRYEFIRDHRYVVHPCFLIPMKDPETSVERLQGYVRVASAPAVERFDLTLWLSMAAVVAIGASYTPADEIGLTQEQLYACAAGGFGIALIYSELNRTERNASRIEQWKREKNAADVHNAALFRSVNERISQENQVARSLNQNRGIIAVRDSTTGTDAVVRLVP
jgi:hypothetical protein